MSISEDENILPFLKEKHIKYSIRILQVLPEQFQQNDSSRLVLAFFAISTLDLLDSLPNCDSKRDIIDWIYHLQVVPNEDESNIKKCGFRGSTPCTVFGIDVKCTECFDKPHIAMTYTGLATLLILGDDLSRVNKKAIICSLKHLQLSDGSFRPIASECENDMRFIYCASCISYMLNDWSGVDTESAISYILKSITYEGGIAEGPGLEAHGGSTFCAVASLYLMGKLNALSKTQFKNLQRWCLCRQRDGFQSRPNKALDTCYSFWLGSALKLLNSYKFVNSNDLKNFILVRQDPIIGGITKDASDVPDPMHTYMAISGLSLLNFEEVLPVHPALNISQRAFAFLKSLHKKWSDPHIS